MDSGVLVMSRIEKDSILNSVRLAISQNLNDNENICKVNDYETNQLVSKQVTKIVSSYVDYVNEKVWFKN